MAEDLLVGMEGDGGAAAVGGGADLPHRPLRQAAGEALLEQFLVAGDLDHHRIRQRVDHAGADAVQAARGLVGLAGELAAGMQRAEDHLQRRLAGELGMRVHRDAAAVVADGDGMVGVKLHLDPVGMARHRLVHRIVENLRDEVVERAFVGAADIHAGALPDRLQPLQHLDGMGVVVVGAGGEEIVGHDAALVLVGGGLDHALGPGASGRASGRAGGRG